MVRNWRGLPQWMKGCKPLMELVGETGIFLVMPSHKREFVCECEHTKQATTGMAPRAYHDLLDANDRFTDRPRRFLFLLDDSNCCVVFVFLFRFFCSGGLSLVTSCHPIRLYFFLGSGQQIFFLGGIFSNEAIISELVDGPCPRCTDEVPIPVEIRQLLFAQQIIFHQ